MRARFRLAWTLPAFALGVIAYAVSRDPPRPDPAPPAVEPALAPSQATASQACAARTLPAPSDDPVQLTCAQARAVAAQARANLAQPPPRVEARELAASTADWLDPHGLWSAAPDSPVGTLLERAAPALLASLIDSTDPRGCHAASAVGRELATWVDSLREAFDRSHRTAHSQQDPLAVAGTALFEDGPVQVPALTLATDLGLRSASLQPIGPMAKQIHGAIRRRMFPALSSEAWGNAVLAAALRSYVLLIDAHGAWAPFDEETSLYEVELEASGRRHLWGNMTRTVAGVRVDEHAVAPLQTDDVVLSIDGVATAGLSVEQVEQLGVLDPNDEYPSRQILLLRRGVPWPVRVRVDPPAPSWVPDAAYQSIRVSTVRYRKGRVAVVAVLDVPDDLGTELTSALADVRLSGEPEGVVLDLRGNGGGSIEGAKEALSPFLPGAHLFPMRRRNGVVEVEQAPVPAPTDVWPGPVAVLVDPDTASAAEMIAGALAAYDRGVVVGARTFGKGCAQEYLDDAAGMGVLRLSTLVYALPDGRPVQKVGLQPDVLLDLGEAVEREDSLPNAMVPWKGPDVRTTGLIRSVPWPLHGGEVGPCEDEVVCKALRGLGSREPLVVSRKGRQGAPRR